MIEQSTNLLQQAMRAQREDADKQQQAADKVACCSLLHDIMLDFGTDEEAAAAAAALQAAQQQAAQHEAQPRLLGEAGGGEAHYARPQDEPPAHPRP